jgi:hypothetical protein
MKNKSLNNRSSFLVALALACAALFSFAAPSVQAGALTPGNLVVLQSDAQTSAAATVSLLEFTTSGTTQTATNTVTIPSTVASAPNNAAITQSGSATSEGFLNRSQDGRYLIVVGYNAASGATGVATGSADRVVGRIDSSGAVDSTTRVAGLSGKNIRSAVSDNGSTIYVAGSQPTVGIQSIAFGTQPTNGNVITAANTIGLGIFGSQLYAHGSIGTLGTVGSGLPTSTAGFTALTAVNGTNATTIGSNASNQYYFLDRDSNIAGVDQCFIADGASGIKKYSYNGTTWSLQGTITGTFFGLLVEPNGSGTVIYATTGAGATAANTLVKYTDSAAYNAAGSFSAATTLATASTGKAFRGLAFAPVASSATAPGAPTVNSVTSSNQALSVGFTAGTNNGSSITNYQYSTNGTNGTFTAFNPAQTNSPLTITNLVNGTTYSLSFKALNLVGPSVSTPATNGTPYTTPAVPTVTGVTSSNRALSVAFTAGTNNGSSITNYQYSTNGTSGTFTAFNPAQTNSPLTITNLVNGVPYSLSFKAVNAAGAGSASTATNGTPYTTPEAPTSLSVTSGDNQVTIAFTAGTNNGSSITNYQYSTNGTNGTFTAFDPAQIGSSVTIAGLSNGTAYTFALKAVNAAGAGSPSTTVSGTPIAPANPTITLGSSSLASAMTTTYGAASSPQSFTLSGTALTGGLIVSAPAGFVISTIAESGYASSLNLPNLSGSVSSTTIYVRLAATTAAGTYSGDVSISGGGAATKNVATVSSTVATKALSITGAAATNKEYDGTTTIVVVGGSLSGVVEGDTVILGGSPAGTVTSAAAGTGKAVAVTGYSIGGASSGNYVLTQPTSLTANITAKALTVANAAVTSRAYDGTDVATITGTLDGMVVDEEVTFNGTGTFANPNAGTGIAVMSTSTISGAQSGNYSLSQPTELTGTITQATQTITFNALANKVAGDVDFQLGARVSSSLPLTYASSNSGVATVSSSGLVTIVGAGTTDITVSQAGNSNYNAATSVVQTLTVTVPPASLTLTTTPSPMSGFNAALGSNSDVQTLNVVGLNLLNDVVISPVAGFEFSTNGINYFTNGLTLPKGNGGLTNDISVRMVSNAAGGLLGGSISVATITNGTSSLIRSTPVRGAVGVYWDFTSASPATNAVPQGWTLGSVTQGNIFGSVVMLSSTSSNALGVYTGASSGTNAQIAAQVGALSLSNSAYFEIPIVVPDTDTNTLTDYGIQKIVFGSRATSTGPQKYTIRTSQDNYASDIASGILGNNSVWAAYSNNNLGLILSKGTNTVRIYGSDGAGSASSSSANWRIDDLVMTLGSVINTNPTLSFLPGNIAGLKGFTGSPSPSINYVVKGANLATNLNLQVSTNAIQISTDNTTFTNQLTLNPTNGVLLNTVYVRLSSLAPLGSLTNGYVQNVSGSLTNTLSVAGTVYDAARGGSAATLAGWDVNDQVNFGPSPLAPTIKNSDVIVGGMTRGSGVETSSTGAGRAWGGTTWENTNSVDAIANGKFVTFTLQATNGKTLSVTNLSKFNYRAATSFGPTNGLIQYQVGSGAFKDVTQVTYTNNSNGQTLSPVNLSGIQDLQNVPASQQITFRIVNWGGQTNPNPAFPGSWYIFDTVVTPDIDFEVTGSVADALPAPTGLSYTTSSLNATALTPIASLSPTVTGSGITYSIDPSLPDGLVINPLTGVISGTPSAAAASAIYTVTASNAGGSTTTRLTISVDAVTADTTAPVITRIGNASIVVAWGASYTDAGATATDNVDSSVTVTPSGSVNTAVPGTYTITYNARDAANNSATPVTRTVTVSAPSSEVGADGLSGLLRYAFGANGPSDTVTKPTSTLSAGKLAITAIVRTNNPNLTVLGQAVTDLPNYASGTSIVEADVSRDTDQANVTTGCERQVFSIGQGVDAKKFLRLKATLNP